jgi:hypothetical protein
MRLNIAAMCTRYIAPSKIGALLAIQPGQRSASRHTLPWCFEPEAQRKSDATHTASDLTLPRGPGRSSNSPSHFIGSRREVCSKRYFLGSAGSRDM